ncbi:ABC transporter permease [Nocardioides soli]|uniref:ABC-type transport system involved in multi-copper enzyme maturation permease subunit n=1 Tax=Nocardioides soli TaxID=1036020 RepID=A0A7W4VTG0_9ACTN|nr:ABC transporter permease [Nocardioides soli]MBB3041067.1 ABC-type transport system involved in multi-copper enzyme maturation permease subunit [Nocardioides soli]
MNSTVAPGLGHALDISGTSPTPFSRLVRTELRKTWDTRAGLWLLIATAALTGVVMVIQLAVVVAQDLTVSYNDFLTSTNFSIALLLPVIGILLLTSEWSQRTAMVTFSLEPRRPLVILAKLVVGIGLAVAAVAIALVLATICNALYGLLSDFPVVWDLSVLQTLAFVLMQIIGMLTGFAFAALLLNSPAAIVLYMVYSFVLPGIFGLGAALIGWFEDLQPWIDFSDAQTPLIDASMSGEDWAHFAVSGVIWLVIPLAIGVLRVLRAEVK